ncbi:MAG: radical SAM protein [Proteobacteria bacterium]|nr:radical SAM protein [Pseudomonadota bacterium]
MSHIFGPVPSRRLGYSLGIDAVPFKVCTLNCVYCQVGRTSVKTLERKQWIAPQAILDDLRNILAKEEKIDFITFSGSGEPTLNSALGEMIGRIKDMTSTPVAVLTNGTLFHLPEVRRDVIEANVIVPSFDAVSPDVFARLNRPHPELTVEHMVEGLKLLRKEFRGQIWLEVMIVKNINDSMDELKKIAAALHDISPDKIQINSVFRPAAERNIEPALMETLELAKVLFGETAEIIEEFRSDRHNAVVDDIKGAIIQLIKRRPCAVGDISKSLGIHEAILTTHLEILLQEQRIKEVIHRGIKFYQT